MGTIKVKVLNDAKKVDPKTLDKFVADIADDTDRNNHSEARVKIAKFSGNKKLEKIFKAIEDIADAEGNLPSEISKYRYSKEQDMWKYLESQFGKEVKDRIYKAT